MIHSEVSAAPEAHRKRKGRAVAGALADVVICTLDTAAAPDIDLD